MAGIEVRKPIYFKLREKDAATGEVVEKIVKVDEIIEKHYSDQLLMLLLIAHRPEKYRENYEVKHSGAQKIVVEYVDGSGDGTESE